MNKQDLLNNLSSDEDKRLIGKILDQYQFCIQKNKITNTNFLNLAQKQLVQTSLSKLKISNYLFTGAYDECERSMLVFYPTKFSLEIVNSHLDNLISIIRISLPKELHSTYTHRDFLGGIMKLGIEREKIGDILVFENGADIIVCKDMLDYLANNLPSLTRFKKSQIRCLDINSLRHPISQTEAVQICISAMRLDCIVAELMHCSRSKACEIIASEKVFVNFALETKNKRILQNNDVLTIRGKGRYEIDSPLGNTRKGNIVLKVNKYK